MILQRYIEEWRATVPWTTDAQVEQDLDKDFMEDIRLILMQ
jgi:hypothetical protein